MLWGVYNARCSFCWIRPVLFDTNRLREDTLCSFSSWYFPLEKALMLPVSWTVSMYMRSSGRVAFWTQISASDRPYYTWTDSIWHLSWDIDVCLGSKISSEIELYFSYLANTNIDWESYGTLCYLKTSKMYYFPFKSRKSFWDTTITSGEETSDIIWLGFIMITTASVIWAL